MTDGFSEVYDAYISSIRITAMGQRVPDLDHDDIVQEMVTCLWKAHQTYRKCTTTFGAYWWSIWLNRKSDLLSAAGAQKRPKTIGFGHMWEMDTHPTYAMPSWPKPPRGSGETEQIVWHMLASGHPRQEVIARTGISRRRYYDILDAWRKEEIRSRLTP